MTELRVTSAPFPSTPVGKQGAIPIATRVEPPSVASRVAEDFIVYPHHLVFSVEPKAESHHAWKTGMPLTARQARVGEAARSMCNFRMFGDDATRSSIDRDYNIRFLGVSYEGTPDYRAAQASPDSNGRYSVSISGKATIFCDTRTLKGAKIGDVIFAQPKPAKFTWQDGSRKFNPPELGFYSPSGLYSRSTHAGNLVAEQLICDGPMTPYEYDYAFRTFNATVEPAMYPEIRAAIGSFRGHRYVGTPESSIAVANAALNVLITDADVAKKATDLITEIGDSKAMPAAMALACGRMYAFKNNSTGERFGEVPGATAEEQRALEQLVKNVAGEEFDSSTAIGTTMKQEDMKKLMDDISKHRRGYPLLGIVAAQQNAKIAAPLTTILDEGSHTATAGSFHQHAATIRTAAMMAGRPAKRIRTGASFGTSAHMGGADNDKYVIGTLVELGDWSGRPNECSILIDPRLGL